MQFHEVEEQLLSPGNFTRSNNPLTDLLLRELPPEWFCVWSYLWRITIGYQRSAIGKTMDDIADCCTVHRGVINRALWFFHTSQLLRFTPGKKGEKSCFEVFPVGLPDVGELSRMIKCLHSVLADEKDFRGTNRERRNIRYSNETFCMKLMLEWQKVGGRISDEKFLAPGTPKIHLVSEAGMQTFRVADSEISSLAENASPEFEQFKWRTCSNYFPEEMQGAVATAAQRKEIIAQAERCGTTGLGEAMREWINNRELPIDSLRFDKFGAWLRECGSYVKKYAEKRRQIKAKQEREVSTIA